MTTCPHCPGLGHLHVHHPPRPHQHPDRHRELGHVRPRATWPGRRSGRQAEGGGHETRGHARLLHVSPRLQAPGRPGDRLQGRRWVTATRVTRIAVYYQRVRSHVVWHGHHVLAGAVSAAGDRVAARARARPQQLLRRHRILRLPLRLQADRQAEHRVSGSQHEDDNLFNIY